MLGIIAALVSASVRCVRGGARPSCSARPEISSACGEERNAEAPVGRRREPDDGCRCIAAIGWQACNDGKRLSPVIGHAYGNSAQRSASLPVWTHFYNWHPQHHGTELNVPVSRLAAFRKNVLTLHS